MVLAAIAVYFAAKSSLVGEVDQDLKTLVTESRSKKTYAYFGSSVELMPSAQSDFLFPSHRFGGPSGEIQVVNQQGNIIQRKHSESKQTLPVTSMVKEVAGGKKSEGFQTVKIGHDHIRMYAKHIDIASGMAVQSGRSLQEITQSLSDLKAKLVLIVLFSSLFAGLGTLGVVYAMKQPLKNLTDSMNRIKTTQDLSQVLPAEGKDEIAELTRSFNSLLKEINLIHSKQSRFVADASHEMRTPLTVLRTNIQMLSNPKLSQTDKQAVLAETEEETRQLTDMINALLLLSREEKFETTPVDLGELTHQAVERANRHFEDTNFKFSCYQPLEIPLAPNLFNRALDNLLKNAAQWTHQGVEVKVEKNKIKIIDHGPGISKEDQEHIWDRFYRSSQARGKEGSGLGLALTKEAVEKSNAKIHVEDTPGGGATFVIEFIEN